MTFVFLIAFALAAATPAGACPAQAEPAALSSAAFKIPSRGETLLFSVAPSSLSVRYALRIVRPNGASGSSAQLVRLHRRMDCNVHDRAGEWSFKLTRAETDSIFKAASDLQRVAEGAPLEVVLDGTAVEVQRYSDGKRSFNYDSNAGPKEQLSATVLEILKRHVPPSELPRSNDWRYRLAGTTF